MVQTQERILWYRRLKTYFSSGTDMYGSRVVEWWENENERLKTARSSFSQKLWTQFLDSVVLEPILRSLVMYNASAVKIYNEYRSAFWKQKYFLLGTLKNDLDSYRNTYNAGVVVVNLQVVGLAPYKPENILAYVLLVFGSAELSSSKYIHSHGSSSGQCYDQYFCRFWPLLQKIIGDRCYDYFLDWISS
jgi:hypothetical protein